jgi:CRP-like cAMP-binding protein
MSKMREFKAGQVIFRENDAGDTAFLIERGRVEIVKGSGKATVHIAYIEANQPFGEMSMIDDKPRSATAVAVEDTVVQELHRDDFLQNLESHPKIAMNLLRLLFERLREADATILQLSRSSSLTAPTQPSRFRREQVNAGSEFVVTLSGITAEARAALPEEIVRITRFPFRIGRRSADESTDNDLSLPDEQPFRVSRHHVSIIKAGNRIGVSDRSSATGSMLNGQRFGGADSHASTIFLSSPEATLILGDETSPYQFKIGIDLAEA